MRGRSTPEYARLARITLKSRSYPSSINRSPTVGSTRPSVHRAAAMATATASAKPSLTNTETSPQALVGRSPSPRGTGSPGDRAAPTPSRSA